MRRLLLLALAVFVGWGAWSHWRHRPVHAPPGVLAPQAPQQVDLAHGTQLVRGDVTLTTRAHFELTGRVLSRKDYSWDAGASLVPVDLAIGWGRMSDSAVLAHIAITQSGRFAHWQVATFPIPRREIETSSSNMHIIPADAGVKYQLEQVRTGQLVHLEGFLVDATRADGWHWNTSMTREDTGGGACELIYVERLVATTPPGG